MFTVEIKTEVSSLAESVLMPPYCITLFCSIRASLNWEAR